MSALEMILDFLLFISSCPAYQLQPNSLTRQGVVVTPEGQPVARAEVWVVASNLPQALATAKTDKEGRFTVTYRYLDRMEGLPQIVVRDGQGRLGWSPYLYSEADAEIPLRIELRSVTQTTGRILADNKPLAGVKISVRQLYGKTESPSREMLPLPAFLSEQFTTTTDAQGRFTLTGVVAGGNLLADLAVPTYSRFQVYWSVSKPLEISLRAAARLEGTFTGPVDPKRLAGTTVQFRSHHSNNSSQDRWTIMQDVTATVQRDGRFVVEKLLPLDGKVSLAAQENVPALAEEAAVKLAPGQNTSVILKLQPAATLKGRVVDQASGAGVAQVRLRIHQVLEREGVSRLIGQRHVTTQADGTFTAFVPTGKVRIFLDRLPEDYVPLIRTLDDPEIWPEVSLTAGQSVDLPLLQLTRAATLQGQAVDDQGKPVAGAEVYVIVPEGPGRRMGLPRPTTRTDAEGRFTLKGLDPTDTLPIRIRSADGTTAGAVVVTPGEIKELLTLKVTPQQAVRYIGRVVDQQGKPIAGARVDVEWSCRYVSKKSRLSGMGLRLDSHLTDAEGRFLTKPLWSGDSYTLQVTAENCTAGSAGRLPVKTGQPVEVPPIRLLRAKGAVSGQVVDWQDRPVAAQVFTRADGPKPVTTLTDKTGSSI
jgi:protocatechuate 3,4-dioxygenase beta subunit